MTIHELPTELLTSLGDIAIERVRLFPTPGTATEADAVYECETGLLCELVNGTLVEKVMGYPQSSLGSVLLMFLGVHAFPRNAGMPGMADALHRMEGGNLRLPDVSFTLRERLPNPLPQVAGWCPDLCVEILSPSNTRREMATKRVEYFASGCRLVWEIDPRTRTADVYTAPDVHMHLDTDGVLDGGDVLPEFRLPLAELFATYDRALPS